MPDKEKELPKSDEIQDGTKTARTTIMEVTADEAVLGEEEKSRLHDMKPGEMKPIEEDKTARRKKSGEKVNMAESPRRKEKKDDSKDGKADSNDEKENEGERKKKVKSDTTQQRKKKSKYTGGAKSPDRNAKSPDKKAKSPDKKEEISDRKKEEISSKRKVQKRPTAHKPEETTKKLEKLKQNLIKQEVSKRSSKIKNRKSRAERKSLKERLKKKFDSISSYFTSKGFQQSLKSAQRKLSMTSQKKVNAGDDTFPINAAQKKAVDADSYEEDDVMMKDTTHRADLVLVKNLDNKGNLFVDGKPFWKDKKFDSEIQADNKLLSKVLVEVVNNKRTLMEPSDEPADLDEFQEVADMKSRDEMWFKEDHITSNTIRSIVGTMVCEEPAVALRREARKPLTIVEPKQMLSYRRFYVPQGVNVPFVKSPANVLRELKVKQPKSGSSSGSSSSPSASSSSSTSNAGDKKSPDSGKKPPKKEEKRPAK